ncbi:MAG: exodeoxyribonuclease VII small subunit [Pseudomonadota bacterium]
MADQKIEDMSFEQALQELEGIVGKLEQGDVALDESIAIYERGEALKRHCESRLAAAEKRVEKIRFDANGQAAGTEPLDG